MIRARRDTAPTTPPGVVSIPCGPSDIGWEPAARIGVTDRNR
jgi:hypothetical protein